MPTPDFFLVGAPKCGTTSMTSYLRQHPDIFIPEGKEFHYFGSDLNDEGLFGFMESEERYRSLFEVATSEQKVGEASVWYLFSQTAAKEIKDFNPEAKIIIMLRNPVEMLPSLHSQWTYNANETIEDFEKALEAEEDRKKGERIPDTVIFPQGLHYRDTARYHDQVKRYFEAFGRENVKVLIFDDFVEDTEAVYRETLEFLGVDSSFVAEFTRKNPNTSVHSQAVNRFFRNPPELIGKPVRSLVKNLPNIFRQRLLYWYKLIMTRYEDRDEIKPEVKKELREEFRPEVDRLSNLLERDLTHWYRPQDT